VKTIGFKPENFVLLLQGPDVKSTTIRAGDKTKRFRVGERVEARCNKDHRAVECSVTSLRVCTVDDLGDHNARDDGLANIRELWAVLQKLNPGMALGDSVTIVGLRVVGEVRDTWWEPFPVKALVTLSDALYLRYANDPQTAGELQEQIERELQRRKPGVEA